MSGLAALCLLLLQTGVSGFRMNLFVPSRGESVIHEDITETAILNITAQVCQARALAEGKDFTFPRLTAESVAVACEGSSKSFQGTIKLIQKKNRRIDIVHFLDPHYHFDNEQFSEGRKVITEGLSAVKASNKRNNFEAAKDKLGKILHPLQDFYSHSNWVEMENTLPYSNLIKSNTDIGNLADDRATCRNCDGDDCRNNILEDILREKLLTSGYFDYQSSNKPQGKCSHGGKDDQTSKTEPKGGISKDTLDASHGHLHTEAANMAIAATIELLEDIRWASGDEPFLHMMGVPKGKALCFVVDTTGSMISDIRSLRTLTSSIIKSKVGTEDEPSVYVLVPFHDPEFGPLTKTTDPKVFQDAVNALAATGGGDTPEMSLSGLQLALTGAPPNSEIFLFTDAVAKDAHLKSTVMALIERTKLVVNFMITNLLGFRRRRQSSDSQVQQQQQQQQQRNRRMVESDIQLYRELAQASGGLAIDVSKIELSVANSIVTESTSSSRVALLYAVRNPGNTQQFNFTVDDTIKNVIVYITGESVDVTLTSPSGESELLLMLTSTQTVGNFKTLKLKEETGLWKIKVVSTNPYTLKVVGESPIDVLFDFLEVSSGPNGGYDVSDSRPRAGVNGSLMIVTVTGSESATVTEVILTETSGSGEVHGSVEAEGRGDFLTRFDSLPAEEFMVVVKGRTNDGSSKASLINFQRQSLTSMKASTVTVTSPDSNTVLVPGIPLSVPFSVTTSGAGGTFSVQATNDQGYTLTFPSSLILDTGGSANGTVTLTAPSNTPSGTDVTLTITAEAPGGGDTNYVVLRFTVLKTVTDFTLPVCQLLTLESNCSDSDCISLKWKLSVQVTDGAEVPAVDRVSLKQGDGTLDTSLTADSESKMLISYSASCCSPDVELIAVDQVGNVASCSYNVWKAAAMITTTSSNQVVTNPATTSSQQQPSATTSSTDVASGVAPAIASLSSRVVQSFLLCLSITILGFNVPF